MNTLIYSSTDDRDESQILHEIRHHNVQIVRSVEDLILRLSKAPCDHGISTVILLAQCMNEVEKFVEMREYFTDKALILILPEEAPALTSLACRLRVKYMGFRGGTFEDVAAVVAQIQRRISQTSR
jgi:hypothetical protein